MGGELAALNVGLGIVVWFLPGRMDSRWMAVAPLTIASMMLLASTVVDLTWPASDAIVRVARLGQRRPSVPQRLRHVLVTVTGVLVALLVTGGVTAAADGHSVSAWAATDGTTVSPWPGWYYATPMLTALAALMAITWWSLRVIDSRPAAADDGSGMDPDSRRRSKVRVYRTATLGVLITLAAVAVVMGNALVGLAANLRLADSPLAMQRPLDWCEYGGRALVIAGLVALGCSFWVAGWRAALSPR